MIDALARHIAASLSLDGALILDPGRTIEYRPAAAEIDDTVSVDTTRSGRAADDVTPADTAADDITPDRTTADRTIAGAQWKPSTWPAFSEKPAALLVSGLLGAGGMGLVHLAVQSRLGERWQSNHFAPIGDMTGHAPCCFVKRA